MVNHPKQDVGPLTTIKDASLPSHPPLRCLFLAVTDTVKGRFCGRMDKPIIFRSVPVIVVFLG